MAARAVCDTCMTFTEVLKSYVAKLMWLQVWNSKCHLASYTLPHASLPSQYQRQHDSGTEHFIKYSFGHSIACMKKLAETK